MSIRDRHLHGLHEPKATSPSWEETANRNYDLYRKVGEERDALRDERKKLLAALTFYADPDTYHAVAFWFDPQCGDFKDDFSNCGMAGMKPGKKARIALGLEEQDAMSAPWEIWVERLEDYHPQSYNVPRDDGVRYIRADLTCGECGIFHNDPGKCRHANINDGDAPACMACEPRRI